MDLRISQLPFITSGAPNSILAVVDYTTAVTGVTSAIYFSSVTANLSGATGSSGTSGTNGTSGSSGTSPVSPYPYVYGLFSQTGNSDTISGTTSQLSLVGPGKGSLTISANTFTVGDSFQVKLSGHISAKNNDTLTVRVKTGSVILGTTNAMTMPTITDKDFELTIFFTIRALGTATNASIVSQGTFLYLVDSSSKFEGVNFSTVNNTTFDTTITNTLDLTAQFSSSDSGNVIFTELLILNKIY